MACAFAPRRTVTCSTCKETGHNMRTCPFGYADHFEPVECQLVHARQFEPCYRFDPVCFLNELLPIDTVNCILLDTTNLDLLADTATKASKLLPIKKKVMFSDKQFFPKTLFFRTKNVFWKKTIFLLQKKYLKNNIY